ncbi:hypothetical protein KY290_027120 [Solanum tuberosum]|uniref:Uncharacterized protein n=1 Tax=Solanum tuberosum TaxID=4113 RepID=A0ABQ7UE74_SOLTU|nr:hypothetical protein KY284_026082 [Solanum tuberosum]KAH0747888.1 hypothetical protein KY290_027120 [Solanum tuberosum]
MIVHARKISFNLSNRTCYLPGNHILVVDQTGMIQMVSTGDVVRAVASERRDKLNRFNAYIQGGY